MPTPLEARKAYLAVVAHLLLADFQVTDEEHRLLSDVATRLQVSRDDLQAVLRGVDIGGDIRPLVAQIPPELHTKLVADLEEAALIDGEVAAREQSMINKVRAMLR